MHNFSNLLISKFQMMKLVLKVNLTLFHVSADHSGCLREGQNIWYRSDLSPCFVFSQKVYHGTYLSEPIYNKIRYIHTHTHWKIFLPDRGLRDVS